MISLGYVFRPWHLRWQTTSEEASQPMPDDDLIANPTLELTRAITIEAPAANVWPWLVQMGYRRAGWYSYYFFDNDGVHVNRILPEFQERYSVMTGGSNCLSADQPYRTWSIAPRRSSVTWRR
jgi:hypothetical protein